MPKRSADTLRPITITPHYVIHPAGSVLIQFGDTHVLCTASVEDRVPPFLKGKGEGWVTAEYDMLPGSTNTRKQRDAHKGKINSRSQEISRLIGRSLRSVIDTTKIGERTITIDCDVIQADGGTRTAAITGGYVALAHAVGVMQKREQLQSNPMTGQVAAVSVGIIDDTLMLDLDYQLDVRADVDMNVVMLGDGQLAEVQGTAEGRTFSRKELDGLLDLAFGALPTIKDIQQQALEIPQNEERRHVHTP